MHRVRLSVQENRLRSTVISEADYVSSIEVHGRGWVVESQGQIVAFAIGNAKDGSIWALFVHPEHEGRGYGRQLHEVMVKWLRSQGQQLLWLTTDLGTRAQRFYEEAGWSFVGSTEKGDARFELVQP